MATADRSLIQRLVHEEIGRIVADAIAHPGAIQSNQIAQLIAKAYPNCGIEVGEVVELINLAAVNSGVALELRRA